MHLAITSGHTDMIDRLLELRDLDVNVKTGDDRSALIFALTPPYTDGPPFKLATSLLTKGALANQQSADTGDSLLQTLARAQLEEACIFLAASCNLNHINRTGLTALHIACDMGLTRLARALLERNASPNLQSGITDLKSALHFAVIADRSEIISAFVDHKLALPEGAEAPDFNLKNADGDGPLSLALALGRVGVVPLLIRGGADVNARNGQDLTLLHQAILKEDADTACFLLKQGADMNALTGEQESALQLAIYSRLPTVVDALCTQGVSLCAPDNRGDPPLWTAVSTDLHDIAAVLVRHGVDTDCWAAGPEGCLHTLLHRAIDENLVAAAVFLIKSGCELDAVRQPGPNGEGGDEAKDRATPMHLCCNFGLVRVLQTLIDYGANVNAVDCDLKTPLHIAIENQYDDIIGILLCHPGIDLKLRDKGGNTTFATALTVRNNKAAQSILERMPNAAEQMDQRGRNFLHMAIMKDDLESVLFLLAIQVGQFFFYTKG